MAGTTLKKENFPESVKGLVNKSKTDLLNIIARKDDVETRLNKENAEMKKKIEELNNTVVEQSVIIKKLNASVNELNTSVRIKQGDFNIIVEDYERIRKNFNCCFVTLVIAVAIIVGLLIYFL
jgi:t-SNARE complex subunit (syntaxin)